MFLTRKLGSAQYQSPVVFILVLILIATTSCRSSGPRATEVVVLPSVVVPTSTLTATAKPTTQGSTPTPVILDPTSTPEATVVLVQRPNYEIVPIDLDGPFISSCRVPDVNPGPTAFSTAPAPTVVTGTVVTDAALGEYWLAVNDVIRHAVGIVEVFDETWRLDLKAGERAALVSDASGRWSVVCDALTDIPTPAQFKQHRADLITGLMDFGSLLVRTTDDGSSFGQPGQLEILVQLDDLGAYFQNLRRQSLEPSDFGVAAADSTIEFVALDEFRVVVPYPMGWIASTKAAELVVANPGNFSEGLAESIIPDSWRYGPAYRVRRLRNPATIDSREASDKFSFIRGALGDATVPEKMEFSGGAVSGYRSVAFDSQNQWQHTSIIAVAGSYTYIIEAACSAKLSTCPEELDALLSAIEFRK